MDEERTKYILLSDRVGEHVEKGLFLSSKVKAQFLRGQILEALPDEDQPEDPEKIALSETERKGRVDCPTIDVARLTEEEADLLSAISSADERYRIFRERNRLETSKKINVGSKVYVKVKGAPKDVQGVVWYKGNLPTHIGTMFGVEIHSKEGKGLGTSDGTFRNKQYFHCPDDCGLFVAVDKLRLAEGHDLSSKSPKKEASSSKSKLSNIKSIISLPNVFSGSGKGMERHGKLKHSLKLGQRVVTFSGDEEVRGVVLYIADRPDDKGMIAVGIQLDKRKGKGTGFFRGQQRFTCKSDYAIFMPAGEVIPEEDFDAHPMPAEKHLTTERLTNDDGQLSASMGYEVNEKQELRRSLSMSSTRSVSSDEAFKLAAASSGGTKEDVLKTQEQIFAQIQAEKEVPKTETVMREEEQNPENGMEIDENHFNRSSHLNTDSNIHIQNGRSNFYMPTHDMAGTSSGRGSSARQPIAPPGNPYEVLARGLYRNPISSREASSIHQPGGLHYAYPTRNSKYSQPLPVTGLGRQYDVIPDCKVPGTENVVVNEQVDQASGSTHPGELVGWEEQMEGVTGTSSDPFGADFPEYLIDQGLEVGCLAEIPMTGEAPRYGVIRWIGQLPNDNRPVAGLELEEELAGCSDGVFSGKRYFTCPAGRGFFVLLQYIRRDSRFQSDSTIRSGKNFGSMESPSIEGIVPPPLTLLRHSTGMMRGIQGHHNSCYLDSTLYSMFAFTTVFDTLLHRPKNVTKDLEEYGEVQKVLKEEIVNPLRKIGFVRADRVLKLRNLLDKLGTTSGLTNEEKDPEEFLNTLLHQVLKSDSLLRLKSHGSRCEESNYYQIITEKDERIKVASVQNLLQQSFISADLKLAEVPSCLILQMPRFGNKYKMYDIIQPDLTLDITHILEDVPRPCAICGVNPSTYECKDCYLINFSDEGIPSYCTGCNTKVHSHRNRVSHRPRLITVPREYLEYAREEGSYPMEKYTMELFAVVCIATSHYVAFVKCGQGPEAPWCFFDSMADRKGETNGYNIPAVKACPEASKWLAAKPEEIISANERGELSPNMKRLFGDAYMCLYQNLEMEMYK